MTPQEACLCHSEPREHVARVSALHAPRAGAGSANRVRGREAGISSLSRGGCSDLDAGSAATH